VVLVLKRIHQTSLCTLHKSFMNLHISRTAGMCCAGVTTEAELLSPENTVHPDLYTSQLPDVLQVKDAVAA